MENYKLPSNPWEQLFVRTQKVVSRTVAGETLVVPVRGKVGDLGSIYSFNGTGSLVWRLLETPQSLTELIDAVERKFEVGPEQAKKDIARFVEDLLSVELVEVCHSVAMSAAESAGQAAFETAAGSL